MTTSDLLSLIISHLAQVSFLILLVACADRILSHRLPQLVSLLWIAVLIKALIPPYWLSDVGFFSWVEAGLRAQFVPEQLGVSSQAVGSSLLGVMLAVWLLGSLAYALLTTMGWLRIQKQLYFNAKTAPAEVIRCTERLCRRVGIRRIPRVVVADSLGPFVQGFLRPVICLPSGTVASSSNSELEPVLLHELVHLRRKDTLLSILQVIVGCIWWFNPLMRFANRRLTRAIEFSVDQAVTTKHGCDKKHYARSLMRFVDLAASPTPAFGSGISPSWITGLRIKRVLQHQRCCYGWIQKCCTYSGFVAFLFVFLPGKPHQFAGPKCQPAATSETQE